MCCGCGGWRRSPAPTDVRLEFLDGDLLGHAARHAGWALSARADADRPGAALCIGRHSLHQSQGDGARRRRTATVVGGSPCAAVRRPVDRHRLRAAAQWRRGRRCDRAGDQADANLSGPARRAAGRAAQSGRRPAAARLAVVGGGAGGVEICFGLPFHWRKAWPDRRWNSASSIERLQFRTVRRPTSRSLAERRAASPRRAIAVGQVGRSARKGELAFDDGSRASFDLAIWATAPTGPRLARAARPADRRTRFFADAAHAANHGRRAGLRRRRCGDVSRISNAQGWRLCRRPGADLWANLERLLHGRPLVEYRPQRGFLSLLATGDGKAILNYKGFAIHAGWCWKLKNYIDSRFMDMYQDYSPMPAPPRWRCRGRPRCAPAAAARSAGRSSPGACPAGDSAVRTRLARLGPARRCGHPPAARRAAGRGDGRLLRGLSRRPLPRRPRRGAQRHVRRSSTKARLAAGRDGHRHAAARPERAARTVALRTAGRALRELRRSGADARRRAHDRRPDHHIGFSLLADAGVRAAAIENRIRPGRPADIDQTARERRVAGRAHASSLPRSMDGCARARVARQQSACGRDRSAVRRFGRHRRDRLRPGRASFGNVASQRRSGRTAAGRFAAVAGRRRVGG